MPLTEFQAALMRLLAGNRSPDNYLAGGAALHLEPNSKRYSRDLDFFQDSVERVASAFDADRRTLGDSGCQVEVDIRLPGYVRAIVRRGQDATKIEWAHDSAWRFMPVMASDVCGYQLHPIDLATNKLLALVGRDEPRDFLDVLHLHRHLLPLGALCWAAAGKDPGYTPAALLELLRRRGKYRPEDFARLHLAEKVDLAELKQSWRDALDAAEQFIRSRPPDEIGCLYYARSRQAFVQPGADDGDDVVVHYGRPGGVLPGVVAEMSSGTSK
ncbi:MAG: nucleotidyl transferase AbiEii/AbiGii toxin family protein [Deltaproteobacteria bacterium]|nr:nucleotidyl transferase AbiEii/AbiGii toxin family protein [Deltaproteobacteria bacterium]